MTKLASNIATTLLAEMNTDYLKRSLLEFPDKIVALKKRARLLRETFEEADQSRGVLEAIMTTDISDEVSPDTLKSKFSNDKARAAELMKRKAECAEYQNARLKARDAQFALSEVEDELVALYDKFKAVRYVTRMVTAEIELLAGDDVYDETEFGGVGDGMGAGDGMGRDGVMEYTASGREVAAAVGGEQPY